MEQPGDALGWNETTQNLLPAWSQAWGETAHPRGTPEPTSVLGMKVPVWSWVTTAIPLGQRQHLQLEMQSAHRNAFTHPLQWSLGNQGVKMSAESSQGCHPPPCKEAAIYQPWGLMDGSGCSAWGPSDRALWKGKGGLIAAVFSSSPSQR